MTVESIVLPVSTEVTTSCRSSRQTRRVVLRISFRLPRTRLTARCGERPPVAALPSPPSRPIGPAPVFFPERFDQRRASTVTLALGEERSGVDIRTELVPMARIIGSVSADGQTVPGVQVTLVSLGPPAPNFAYAMGDVLARKPPMRKGNSHSSACRQVNTGSRRPLVRSAVGVVDHHRTPIRGWRLQRSKLMALTTPLISRCSLACP